MHLSYAWQRLSVAQLIAFLPLLGLALEFTNTCKNGRRRELIRLQASAHTCFKIAQVG